MPNDPGTFPRDRRRDLGFLLCVFNHQRGDTTCADFAAVAQTGAEAAEADLINGDGGFGVYMIRAARQLADDPTVGLDETTTLQEAMMLFAMLASDLMIADGKTP